MAALPWECLQSVIFEVMDLGPKLLHQSHMLCCVSFLDVPRSRVVDQTPTLVHRLKKSLR